MQNLHLKISKKLNFMASQSIANTEITQARISLTLLPLVIDLFDMQATSLKYFELWHKLQIAFLYERGSKRTSIILSLLLW